MLYHNNRVQIGYRKTSEICTTFVPIDVIQCYRIAENAPVKTIFKHPEENMEKKEPLIYNNLLKNFILIIQILLLFTAVFVIAELGVGHLSTTGIISIAFDLLAMFMLIIIFHNCCHGRVRNNTGEIMGFIITVYLCVFFEVGIWIFDTLPAYRILNYICNMGCNCSILIGAYLYFLFVRKSPGINADIFPKMQKLLLIVMVVGITAEIMNCLGGYFYTVSEQGVYQRSPYGIYLGYIPFLIALISCMLFIIRQKLDIVTKLEYMSYFILPFTCSLWYTITDFPPTFFVASAMSTLLIHGDIYVLQSREIEMIELENEKKDAEYALSQNMLMLSQIKPHFMYNSLGSIEILCKIDPEKAGKAIHHFTHYLRTNMDIVAAGTDTIPFAQELEHIRNYMWLEQMRFEDELEYKEDIEVTDFHVPQLSIQPLIENTVKHGMMGNEDGILHVLLRVKETDSEYVISVRDDGCGFDPDKTPQDGRSHLGINSAAYSLKLCLNASLNIESKIGSGTTVTIRIPKEQEGKTNDNTGRR